MWPRAQCVYIELRTMCAYAHVYTPNYYAVAALTMSARARMYAWLADACMRPIPGGGSSTYGARASD